MRSDRRAAERSALPSAEPPTKALTLRLVTGLRSEEEVHELFRDDLQPWLDHLPLDATIVEIDDADPTEVRERLGAQARDGVWARGPARLASAILCETSDDGLPPPFAEALITFKVAAANLNAAWPEDGPVGNYPAYLPSFDELVADLAAIAEPSGTPVAGEAETANRALVVGCPTCFAGAASGRVEPRCPDCGSPEVERRGQRGSGEEMTCGNCGARFGRGSTLIRLADLEAAFEPGAPGGR
jgi:hypothetical protein